MCNSVMIAYFSDNKGVDTKEVKKEKETPTKAAAAKKEVKKESEPTKKDEEEKEEYVSEYVTTVQ